MNYEKIFTLKQKLLIKNYLNKILSLSESISKETLNINKTKLIQVEIVETDVEIDEPKLVYFPEARVVKIDDYNQLPTNSPRFKTKKKIIIFLSDAIFDYYLDHPSSDFDMKELTIPSINPDKNNVYWIKRRYLEIDEDIELFEFM